MKSATLQKLQTMARDSACRLLYLDEAGFSASPPVQYGWSPKGRPHAIEPQAHCRRSVLGVLDFERNVLHHQIYSDSLKRVDVIAFLDQLALSCSPEQLNVVVLDNARIHHAIEQDILDRWLLQHRMILFYLPPYSPELNLIEIVWKHAKYHWRRFVTWTKQNIEAEIHQLLSGYGSKFEIRFS